MRNATLNSLTIAAIALLGISHAAHAQQWTPPTPAELSMTSVPDSPGADAAILNVEEIDDDDMHVHSFYFRIKILTEAGIARHSSVTLQYRRMPDGAGETFDTIYGRTIQPDGSIVPMTAKPLDSLLEKFGETQIMQRSFSLPAVKVGSILEYRYSMRMDDRYFQSPRWTVQRDIPVLHAHYLWKPTDKILTTTTRGGRENLTQRIAWTTSLPAGTVLKQQQLPTGKITFELTASNMLPFFREEYMPPLRSTIYHVDFYYTPYYNGQEYWDAETKYWNSDTGKFTSASGLVRTEAVAATAGATSDEDKARKLYAYIMQLENTDYTRSRTSAEEKGQIKSAEDVLKRKHGSGDQLAMTYVAMARAVGLNASTMEVADRSNILFQASWLDFGNQLTDSIAVVNYGGADHYLDPGSRYTPFDHLAWQHTMTAAVRQDNKDKAKSLEITPADSYKYSHTSRVGDIKLEADGHMTGIVSLSFEGSPALQWRHIALRNDEAELRNRLKKEIQSWLPNDTEVTVDSVANAQNGEMPLKVVAKIDGHIGTSMGSRVMLPSVLFEQHSRPSFPHEKRDQAVYFPYNQMIQDAVRYTLPAGLTIESAPKDERASFQKLAAYALSSSQTPNSITLRRDLVVGDVLFPLKDFPELRGFYNDFESKDHSSIVLKRATQTASAAQAPAGTN